MGSFQTCGDSTAKYTNFVKRGSRIDLSNTTDMGNSVFTEGRSAHKMVNWLPLNREPRLTIINHNTPVSIDPEEVTHIAFL